MPTETGFNEGRLNAALKYNPHLWGPDELRAIFVVRQRELEEIKSAIQATDWNQVPQHILITGFRGMGKSTLLQRLALSISETPEISKQWLALTFPEEQYTIRSLFEFWRNVLDALADALEKSGDKQNQLALLDQQITELIELPIEQREKAALALISRWIEDKQCGLALMLDSSDRLFDSLDNSGGKKKKQKGNTSTIWRLRKTLSQQPGLFWIGASYQALESEHQYEDAFHDFFSLYELEPLAITEMRQALLALAKRFGVGRGLKGEAAVEEMTRILDQRPERLQTLRLLSGGNPRTTVTLFELFSAGGDDNVQNDLKRLLDIMTPLYKARMEALSGLAQKIFAHIMENWHPLGVKELANLSGLENTAVSSQLSRLETEGLVQKAPLSNTAKRSGYQAAERLFNVWYLMRYGTRRVRQRLTGLVQFMQLWFNREELEKMAIVRASRHQCGELSDNPNLEYSRALASALGNEHRQGMTLEWSVFSSVNRECKKNRKALKRVLPHLFDLNEQDSHFKDAADYLERFNALDKKLLNFGCDIDKEIQQQWLNAVKSTFSLSLPEKEKLAEGTVGLSKDQISEWLDNKKQEDQPLIEKIGDSAFELLNKAILEGNFFPDFPNSQLAYTQMEPFVAYSQLYKQMLWFLQSKFQDEWVVKTYKRAIEISPEPANLYTGLGVMLAEHLKQYHESESAYRKAIELDDSDAWPWIGLGNLLANHLKRYEESESAYRKAIELDENNGYIYANLARVLVLQNRKEEADKNYRLTLDYAKNDALNLNLQAHLWLGNNDLAAQALNSLASQAASGNNYSFFRIKEQCCECFQIGMGDNLAGLMEHSHQAEFLLPFSLALRAAENQEKVVGASPEVLELAKEILEDILVYKPSLTS